MMQHARREFIFKYRLDPPNPMVQIQHRIAPRNQTHCPQWSVVFLKKWLQSFRYSLLQKRSETKKGIFKKKRKKKKKPAPVIVYKEKNYLKIVNIF